MQLDWAKQRLKDLGFALQGEPQSIQHTPWSDIYCFSTDQGRVYLKSSSPHFSLEAQTTQDLHDQFHAPVPQILAVHQASHSFLMQDAGVKLRDYQPKPGDCDQQAIQAYQAIQSHSVPHLQHWLSLGIPDWRLNQLPGLYTAFIHRTHFLEEEGVSAFEDLHRMIPVLTDLCDQLSRYEIAESLDHCDFHERNVLIHPGTGEVTVIDWAEIVVTHPYFSWINYLKKSSGGSVDWFSPVPGAWDLAQKIWPVYAVLSFARFMQASDPIAFKAYYATRSHRIAEYLQAWLHHAS